MEHWVQVSRYSSGIDTGVSSAAELDLDNIPGNESFPSPIPRSFKITEMKWIQLDFSSGKLLALVRSLISAEDMFPTTFIALSTTGTLVSPSLLISWRASVKGRSPLDDYQH